MCSNKAKRDKFLVDLLIFGISIIFVFVVLVQMVHLDTLTCAWTSCPVPYVFSADMTAVLRL